MSYQKPQITVSGSATSSVMVANKQSSCTEHFHGHTSSSGAYEVDE